MTTINRALGSIDGFIYQAHKKSLEAKRLPLERAQAELLGAMNYLAGAWIELERQRKADLSAMLLMDGGKNASTEPLPALEPAAAPLDAISDELGWKPWGGLVPAHLQQPGCVIEPPAIFIAVKRRDGAVHKASDLRGARWEHDGAPHDIVAYC